MSTSVVKDWRLNMSKFKIGNKVSLKLEKVSATRARPLKNGDYKFLDNIDLGLVHVVSRWGNQHCGGSTKIDFALTDPTANVRLEVIDLDPEARLVKCKLLVGSNYRTINYVKRPYVRVDGAVGPQVKEYTDGDVYGRLKNYFNYTIWIQARNLEMTKELQYV